MPNEYIRLPVEGGGGSAITIGVPANGLSLPASVLSLALSSASTVGALSATDWTTFNSKVATTRTISTTSPLSGGGDLSADRTLSMPAATTSVSGYLTSTDWTAFNSKVATTRTISTTSPLSGGGDLSADRTLSIPAATTSVSGYLSSTDWNTFNGKQDAGSYVTANSAITGATNTKISYDSKGLVTSGTSALIDDLGDVTIFAPTVNQILSWNGSQWINSSTPTGAGNGVSLYLDDAPSDISGYFILASSPLGGSEEDDFVDVTSGTSPALIERYATSSAGLGDGFIDGGTWVFSIWAFTSSATGTNTVQIEVYKRSGITETLLFTVATPDLSTTQTLYDIETVQPS